MSWHGKNFSACCLSWKNEFLHPKKTGKAAPVIIPLCVDGFEKTSIIHIKIKFIGKDWNDYLNMSDVKQCEVTTQEVLTTTSAIRTPGQQPPSSGSGTKAITLVLVVLVALLLLIK